MSPGSDYPTLGLSTERGAVIACAEYTDERFVVMLFLNSQCRLGGKNYEVCYWDHGLFDNVTEHSNIVRATADYDGRI